MGIKETGYEDALLKVVKVRLERKKIYGDNWKTDEDWLLLGEIIQKSRRLKENILNLRKEDIIYENTIDSLVDLCNYSLFLLQNKIDEKKKELIEIDIATPVISQNPQQLGLAFQPIAEDNNINSQDRGINSLEPSVREIPDEKEEDIVISELKKEEEKIEDDEEENDDVKEEEEDWDLFK